MNSAIYAGSFDPWTLGHSYVLTSAIKTFKHVTVIVAVNKEKKSHITPQDRARLIAFEKNPFKDWWSTKPPFHLKDNLTIITHSDLIANYARDNNIQYLVRGLRSTTDFEAEFNLYFSNLAINEDLSTWAILCPPEYLHYSSTFARTVVGKSKIPFTGASFTAQALLLNWHKDIGQALDLLTLNGNLPRSQELLTREHHTRMKKVQYIFSQLYGKEKNITQNRISKISSLLKKELYTAKNPNLDSLQKTIKQVLKESFSLDIS